MLRVKVYATKKGSNGRDKLLERASVAHVRLDDYCHQVTAKYAGVKLTIRVWGLGIS